MGDELLSKEVQAKLEQLTENRGRKARLEKELGQAVLELAEAQNKYEAELLRRAEAGDISKETRAALRAELGLVDKQEAVTLRQSLIARFPKFLDEEEQKVRRLVRAEQRKGLEREQKALLDLLKTKIFPHVHDLQKALPAIELITLRGVGWIHVPLGDPKAGENNGLPVPGHCRSLLHFIQYLLFVHGDRLLEKE